MPIGEPFIQLFEVDSTNNYAMAQLQAGLAEHGTAWFAHSQTAGKGQRGKAWISPPSQNILLSVAVKPDRLLHLHQFVLSATVAVAVREFFDVYTNGDTSIKWPNDIYWRDRKAGGILIENLVQGSVWKYAVIGIGLNIQQTQFESHLSNPVSLKQITGKTFDTVEMAQTLCRYLQQRWQQLQSEQYGDIVHVFEQHMYKLNEPVQFRFENATIEAVVKGVNSNGELLLDMGETTPIPVGKVEWLLPN